MKQIVKKSILFLWSGFVCGMGPSTGGAVALRGAQVRCVIGVRPEDSAVLAMKEMILIAAHFLGECSHVAQGTAPAGRPKICLVARNLGSENRIVFEQNGSEFGLSKNCQYLSGAQVAHLCRVLNKHCHHGDGRELKSLLGIRSGLLLTQEVLLSRLRELAVSK